LTWNFIEAVPSTIDPSFLNLTINWQIFEIFIFYIITFTFLTAIFFYDLLYKEIPDRFSIPAIAIAIAGGLLLGLTPPLSMLIGGVGIFAFFALQLVISKGKWIGGGDLRLGALMGILLGWKLGLIALIAAYLFGSIVSIILLLKKKATRKSAIAFGPFLVIGIILAIFYGNQILEWYLGTLTI
jgi:prepilin signal peptidase PulO-like enzyme (type II secretory pathway)